MFRPRGARRFRRDGAGGRGLGDRTEPPCLALGVEPDDRLGSDVVRLPVPLSPTTWERACRQAGTGGGRIIKTVAGAWQSRGEVFRRRRTTPLGYSSRLNAPRAQLTPHPGTIVASVGGGAYRRPIVWRDDQGKIEACDELRSERRSRR